MCLSSEFFHKILLVVQYSHAKILTNKMSYKSIKSMSPNIVKAWLKSLLLKNVNSRLCRRCCGFYVSVRIEWLFFLGIVLINKSPFMKYIQKQNLEMWSGCIKGAQMSQGCMRYEIIISNNSSVFSSMTNR